MKKLQELVKRGQIIWPKKDERWDYLELMYVLTLRSKIIVEFGLEHGLSTRVLLLAAEVSGGKVYSIDWMERYEDINKKTINSLLKNPLWRFRKADVGKYNWRKEKETGDRGKIDFLLGDIGEEYLKAGLENFVPHLSKRAIILVPAIYHPCQPIKARIMKDFAKEHLGWYFIDLDSKHGIGILMRM